MRWLAVLEYCHPMGNPLEYIDLLISKPSKITNIAIHPPLLTKLQWKPNSEHTTLFHS